MPEVVNTNVQGADLQENCFKRTHFANIATAKLKKNYI